MRYRIKKMIAFVAAATMICSSVNVMANSSNEIYQKHAVAAGESREGNPLKGLFAFGGTTNMPVSMEYFAMPVNAVQKGMDEYDWSGFEKKLNDAAGRGHQAVLRFYYDSPGDATGIPEFVLQNGLETKNYGRNGASDTGICPDYSDAYFRQSMQAFIAEFGKQYDGDGRIGFITLGLLGFWGEWHNYPYDEDASTKAFYKIPTEVQKEVLDAYESAFTITKLCAREPKSGIDFSKYHIGFHDDSFGYATLSQANGGVGWHFMQKLKNANLADIWQSECIGGEVYPPSQDGIFSGEKGDYQDWNLCMEESHASWMICNQIKSYSGEVLKNAKEASKHMGYDLRVNAAYYNDIDTKQDLYVGIEMENIGVAPFYYDHRTWPVVLGVKKSGTIVKTWETDWDLCKVAAGNTLKFETTIANTQLDVGEYTLCLKVKNPVENGQILGFANEKQGEDGWLELDELTVKEVKVSEEMNEDKTETSTAVSSETSENGSEVTENKSEASTELKTDGEKKLQKQKITTAKIKKYKAKNLKKKKVSFSLKAKTTGDGKLTYKVTKTPKKGKKSIKVSKKGKVTLKKNAPKGTYQITVTATKTETYAKATKKIKIKIK